MKTKLKKKLRAVLSITVILSLLLAAFAPIEAAALHELTGFADGTVVRFKNVATNGYLNLSRANDANGANVNIFEYDGTPEETWKLRYDATDDCYRIGSMVSSSGNNRVVDVKRGGEAPVHGCNVQLYTATDDTSQQWCFAYYGSGRYYIWLLACSGLALTASTVQSSAGTYNGTPTGTSTTSPGNVYLGSLPGYDSNGNYYGGPTATTIPDNQLWVIEEVNPTRTIADGVYTIKNMASQKMMDATSAGNVVSWGSHGGNNQKWKVTYHNDGFYTLRPMSDLTKALDVESNYDEMGSNIDVWTVGINSTGGDWAKWKIIPNATGSGYRITCKAGYYAHAATVLEGSTANGANVMQVEYCNAASQQWIFTPAEKEAIVVVPGIMGSELYENPTSTNRALVWPPSTDNINILVNLTNNLEMDVNGNSIKNIGVWQDDERESPTYGSLGTYQPLVNKLKQSYPNKSVYFFSYDWRYSNSVSAEALRKFIDVKGITSIILVSHSMGGLVTSSFLQNRANYLKVLKNIVVGSPLLGTPQAIDVMAEGTSMGNFFVSFADGLGINFLSLEEKIVELAPNIPSLYELLPSAQYYSKTSMNTVYYYNPQPNSSIVNTYLQGYHATKNYLYDNALVTNCRNSELLSRAQVFHDSLWNGNAHSSSQCETYYLVGCGLQTITFEEKRGDKMLERPLVNGDGTVVFWTADLGGLYPSSTYYYNATGLSTPGDGHTDLISKTAPLNFIVSIINGNTNGYGSYGFTATRPSIQRLDDTQVIQ